MNLVQRSAFTFFDLHRALVFLLILRRLASSYPTQIGFAVAWNKYFVEVIDSSRDFAGKLFVRFVADSARGY